MDAIEILDGSSDEADKDEDVNRLTQKNHYLPNTVNARNNSGSDSDASDSPAMNLEDRIKLKYGKSQSQSQSSEDSDYESQFIPGQAHQKLKRLMSRAKAAAEVELSSDDSDGFETNKRKKTDVSPEQSMKCMKVILDEAFKDLDFFNDLLKALNESEVQFTVESQLIPKSITWLRKVQDNYIDDKHEVRTNTRAEKEKQVMVIWNQEEAIKHISDNTFFAAVRNIKSLLPDKSLSLVIYNTENYFKYHKNLKDRAVRDEIASGPGSENPKKSRSRAEKNLSALPVVSRAKFDESLVELQLMYNVTCRLIENQAEMVLLIHQYTKSLALLPSKLEKRQELSKIDWYVTSDNRDTVKVDSDGNGLKRLWQQQLCQFSLASLEVAEAISSVYKSPLQLMEAYKDCNPSDGESLLRDIPIRRAAGLITSTRKIGPELSKRIFIMFTSDDGDACLYN
ncbi:hypothetical protein QAD02_022776 [Eretmocerus hayati]|uniref:Uncharacterized protein n=1 Tax=Eretmocerus hayati TaxID=131215 RepID=A0ACC2PXB1_9HYME|nr:hypothetical protein QAD02_022776 [Eretmocerus hayati]